MADPNKDNRFSDRYESHVKVYFDFAYAIETDVEYKVLDRVDERVRPRKYKGVTRNVSTKGICIAADKLLDEGEVVVMDLFLPKSEKPLQLVGEVKWCRPLPKKDVKDGNAYESGIELRIIDGQSVDDSVYYDKEYQVHWSAVLEAVLGTFRLIAQNKLKR